MKTFIKSIFVLSLIVCATSCYRMPEDGEYSLVPSTNNPTYTREKGGSTPGVGY